MFDSESLKIVASHATYQSENTIGELNVCVKGM